MVRWACRNATAAGDRNGAPCRYTSGAAIGTAIATGSLPVVFPRAPPGPRTVWPPKVFAAHCGWPGETLELSNLNRVPATVLDLGLNKATIAARRIAELDPYLNLEVFTSGVTPELVDRFLAGLDVVVDQADSLDIKILLSEAARNRRIPVLMATSDRGQLDVERFDLQPQPSVKCMGYSVTWTRRR